MEILQNLELEVIKSIKRDFVLIINSMILIQKKQTSGPTSQNSVVKERWCR